MSPTPNDVLARAAELIGERGWCQGALQAPEGQLCAMGAIGEAKRELFGLRSMDSNNIKGNRQASRAYQQAYDMLIREINPREMGLTDVRSVPQWNDDPDQTAESVILALKTAANTTD